jgi:hypothetical protein
VRLAGVVSHSMCLRRIVVAELLLVVLDKLDAGGLASPPC